MATNVVPQAAQVTRSQRSHTIGHRGHFHGCTVWLTGLSGAGKSTLAFALEQRLVSMSVPAYSLDGDNIRCGLNRNLGFSAEEREENIRRVGEVSKLFADAGIVCIAAFISPYRSDREKVRQLHLAAGLEFFEVFVDAPLEVCELRDVKGLYAKARSGQISGFTGVDAEYQAPLQPQLRIDTADVTVEHALQLLMSLLAESSVLPATVWPVVHPLPLLPAGDGAPELAAAARPRLQLGLVEAQWAQVLQEGWAHPLRGFMNRKQYLQCLHFGTVTDERDGAVHSQSVPIVLPIGREERQRVADAAVVSLEFGGELIGELAGVEVFGHNRRERCCRTFGTQSLQHPVIAQIMAGDADWLLGGELRLLRPITWKDGLDEYRLTPEQLRSKFSEMKADAVFAFQLRNPIHNGHALLMRDTRQQLLQLGYRNPVLLLHPLGGWTKDDDVPLVVRLRQHAAVLEAGVLDAGSTVTAIFPSPMLYAGPTEVQWHAKARISAGADFYIVGRDPAGIADPEMPGVDLFDPEHGAAVLQLAPGLSRLRIIPFRVAAYNKSSCQMEFFDPERREQFEFISGTKMRQLAREGRHPPDGFMVPSAWDVLSDFYRKEH